MESTKGLEVGQQVEAGVLQFVTTRRMEIERLVKEMKIEEFDVGDRMVFGGRLVLEYSVYRGKRKDGMTTFLNFFSGFYDRNVGVRKGFEEEWKLAKRIYDKTSLVYLARRYGSLAEDFLAGRLCEG
jgi:hypothetical protein